MVAGCRSRSTGNRGSYATDPTDLDVHHQGFVDILLDVAQSLSEQQGTVRSICVQATLDQRIEQVGSELQALLPETTVNTPPEDLAA